MGGLQPLINGPTVGPVGDRYINMWEARNNNSQKKIEVLREVSTLSSATLSIINPKQKALGSNPILRDDKTLVYHRSYSTTSSIMDPKVRLFKSVFLCFATV